MRKADIVLRNGRPAVNVKVNFRGVDGFDGVPFPFPDAGDDPFTREWLASRLENDDHLSIALFSWACESGWEMLRDDVKEIFGRHVEVWAEGRSGGWAVVHGLPDVESWDAIAVARWARFCRYARAIADDIPCQMVGLAYFNAWLPEMAEAVERTTLGERSAA